MILRQTLGATLTLAAILAPAVPGFAQKRPAVPGDPFAEAYDFCMETIAETLGPAATTLTAGGWIVENLPENGIPLHSISASRTVGSIDSYFYVEITQYPVTFHSFCTYEMYGPVGAVDLAGVAERFQLDGRADTGEGGVYGAWEMPLDDGILTIFASQENEYFRFQFNWFEWGAPRN